MIRHWSIRRRILLIALGPATLVAVALGGYFTTAQIADLRETQGGLGNAIVNQLAPASVYGVFTRNRAALQSLANAALREADVEAVAIRDREGETLAAAARPPVPAGATLWERLAARVPVRGQELVFHAPIVLEATVGDETDPYLAEAAPRDAPLGEVVVSLSQRRLAERQLEVIAKGLLITALLLATSVFLALRIARSLDRPLRRVTAAVRRFRDGELGARVPERSGGELGELERGVNTMADAIQRAQQHLREQVEQATTELRQTLEAVEIKNVELDLARKRALAASRVKSEFLANMSHEIRTPMNAILGFTQLLAKTRLDGGQRDYVGTIKRSAGSLLALLEDVLNLSRIEAGKMVLDSAEFDLVELVEHLFAVHAPEAYRKGLELVLVEQADLPSLVVGDAGKVQQVVSNLLHNAIKFTDRGSVTVRIGGAPAQAGRREYCIEVIDTGRGIAAEAREQLFQPFTQLEADDHRRQGGVGLGLAICRKLVETMDGAVSAESTAGRGSRFIVALPLAPVAVQPARVAPLAGVRVIVCEACAEYADALGLRLAAAGADIEHLLDAEPLPDALAHGTSERTLVVLGLADVAALDGVVEAWGRAAPPRALALLRSVDRAEQRRVGRRLGAVCLPRYVGRVALLAELQRLIESDGSAAPDVEAALPAALDALDADVRAMLAEELPRQAAAIVQAFEAGDAASAIDWVHKVRGSAAFCRLPALEGCSATVESLLRDGAPVPAELRLRLANLIDDVAAAAGRASSSAPVPLPGESRLAGLAVLIADDNRVNRELLLRMLAQQGARAQATADAAEAIALLQRGGWDALLMDIHMPDMSGVTAAARVRELPPPFGAVALLAVTANAMPEMRDTALAAGFDEYLVKPVGEDQLVDALRRVLKRRGGALTRSA